MTDRKAKRNATSAARSRRNAKRRSPHSLNAVVADGGGRIIELEGYGAVGMAHLKRVPLHSDGTQPLPHGSELMMMPGRSPLVFDRQTGETVVLERNPYAPDEPVTAVAAFNSPGYVATLVSACRERPGSAGLPLFSYGAVGWGQGGFRSAVIQVDREPRQDLRRMPPGKVAAGIQAMRRRLPENRLARHLETCALTYGCPAGKNFFLGRYEAPLPTSRRCNARCLGCLSLQAGDEVPCSQNRIDFTPSPREIAEVALMHIRSVERAVVSFGQGCEGDPLLAADAIAPAIAQIRQAEDRGTINLNTNGSKPAVVARLLDAGLDSIRISINSLQPTCYTAYFRPRDYGFADVMATVDLALSRGCHVALNYLNLPGFTDCPTEFEALCGFLDRYPVHLIQWRNLNYDPLRYWQAMGDVSDLGKPLGMGRLLDAVRRRYPRLQFGYFNPPREKWAADAGVEP